MERIERSTDTTLKTLGDIRQHFRETAAEEARMHKETMDRIDSINAKLDRMDNTWIRSLTPWTRFAEAETVEIVLCGSGWNDGSPD